MSIFQTRIEVNGIEDCPCTVDYDAFPPCRGSFEPGGLQLEPDDPGGILINLVRLDEDDREIELTSEQERMIEEEIGERLYEMSLPDADRERD